MEHLLAVSMTIHERLTRPFWTRGFLRIQSWHSNLGSPGPGGSGAGQLSPGKRFPVHVCCRKKVVLSYRVGCLANHACSQVKMAMLLHAALVLYDNEPNPRLPSIVINTSVASSSSAHYSSARQPVPLLL